MSSITTQGRGLPPGTQQTLEGLQSRNADIGTGSRGGNLDEQALQILAQEDYSLPSLGNYKSSSVKLPQPRVHGSEGGKSSKSTSTGRSTSSQANVSDYIYAVGLINVNSATLDAQNSTNLANELSAYRQQLFENANQQMTKAAEAQSSANSAAEGAQIACAVITAIFGVALLITGVGALADAGLFAAEAAVDAGVDAGIDAGIEGGIEMTEFASEGSEGMSNLADVGDLGDMSDLNEMDELNPEENTLKDEPESPEKTTEEQTTKETQKEEETRENQKTNDSDSSIDANNEEMEANQKNLNYQRFKRLLQAYTMVNSIIQGSLHIAMAVDQYHANEAQAESQFDTNLAASMNTVESTVLKSMDGYLGDVSTSLKESGSTLSGMVSAIGGMMHAPSPI